MVSKRPEELRARLLRGEVTDIQPWDLAAVVGDIGGRLGREQTITVDQVRTLARALNKERQFAITAALCQAWAETRGPDPTVDRHHAQALLDLGTLDRASDVLTSGRKRIAKSKAFAAELPEYLGLLGRTYKERFVLTRDARWLKAAIQQYYTSYDDRPERYWHAINAVALVARSEREGLGVHGRLSSKRLAAQVLKRVLAAYETNRADHWLLSTASEALLALGRCDEAELWLYRFLHHDRVRPFDLFSFERQLRVIWQGGEDDRCAGRLSRLMSRHVAGLERSWSAEVSDLPRLRASLARADSAAAYERNFLGEGTFSVAAIMKVLAACASIGCVHNSLGERLGTGFLLPGDALSRDFGPAPVFVTNAHVMGTSSALPLADARVTFERDRDNGKRYAVKEQLFHSTQGDFGCCDDRLDTVVVRLDMPAPPDALSAAADLPLLNARARAYVVGHPRGAALQISLHDSLIVDCDDDEHLLHYRTPTDPGNSGSPVFNEDWEVIAVHHGGLSSMPRLRGKGTYEANEGVLIKAIRREIAKRPMV